MTVRPTNGKWLAGLFALWCICASPAPGGDGLTAGQTAKLLEQARQPHDVGIVVRKTGDDIALGNVSALAPGVHASLPFSAGRLSRKTAPQIDIVINGSPTRALLASGLPYSLVDYQRAVRAGTVPLAGLRNTPPGIGTLELLSLGMTTPAGRLDQYLSISPTIHIRNLPIHKVPFGILNDRRGLRALTWLVDADGDVILGHDFLRLFTRVTVDYPNRRLFLAAGGPHHPDKKRLVTTLPLVTTSGVPAAKALLDGKGPFWMGLDTAGDYGLWVPRKIAEALGIPGLLRPPPAPKGRVAKSDPLFMPAGSHTLRMAGLELPDVDVVVATASPPEGSAGFALLGHQVLSRYVVTFDYQQAKIFIENPRPAPR